MFNYRVLKISKNLEEYPECKEDTEKFPQLVDMLSDEMDIFIFNIETTRIFPARDFFYMVDMNSFYVRDGVKGITTGVKLENFK